MRRALAFLLAIAPALVVLAGCASAPPEEPDTADAAIEPIHLMSGMVVLQHRALMQALAEGPADAAQWERAETEAALLAEAGDILLRQASARDEAWQVAAVSLARGGHAAHAAIEARDLAAARAGFEDLNTACSSCHRDCAAGDLPPWR